MAKIQGFRTAGTRENPELDNQLLHTRNFAWLPQFEFRFSSFGSTVAGGPASAYPREESYRQRRPGPLPAHRRRSPRPLTLGAPNGTTPKLMQCPVSNPEQPDVNSVRALRPQTLCCRPKVVGDGPTSAVNVDGDILSVVVRFNLRTDVPLIYLVAQAGSLFARSACGHGGFPALGGHCRSLCVLHASPFVACFCTWSILLLAGVCDNERRSAQGRTGIGHNSHYTTS